MKTLLLVLAIIAVIYKMLSDHKFKTIVCEKHPFFAKSTQRKGAWFIGTLLATGLEAVCWWYIIENLFVK